MPAEWETLARMKISGEITEAIVTAFNTLSVSGVNQVDLFRLIKTRKKSEGGRPASTVRTMRLASAIGDHQFRYPETTEMNALIAVIEQSARDTKSDPEFTANKIASEKMAYGRLKKKLRIELICVLRALRQKAETLCEAKKKSGT